MVVLLSICLWSASIVATCIAAHIALCRDLQKKRIGKKMFSVFEQFVLVLQPDAYVVNVLSDEPSQS